jgi:flagellar biosynthesis protein FlhF
MIIKKFTANTETEAIMLAKEELGSNAVVLSIKSIKQRGLKRLFKKDAVEVTAALEKKTTAPIPVNNINVAISDEQDNKQISHNVYRDVYDEDKRPTAIEEKLDNLQSILEARISENEARKSEDDNIKQEKNVNFTYIQLIYNQLLENEVDEKYINQIISEIESSLKKDNNLDAILASVYQKIILKLGSTVTISADEKNPEVAFFIGPTGVGKTTTIAKIASDFKLNKSLKVAMITSDTYRIAAVEQLRTYANILDIPLQVVYTIEELNTAIDNFKDYDLILVDTAGRSHKNKEQCMEMMHLVKDCNIPERFKKEAFLVLSATAKYKDLINIVETYSDIGQYNLIFTKLDETSALGNILNIKLKTNANLSYITSGQNVPDDIGVIDAQKLAKNLLGGGR